MSGNRAYDILRSYIGKEWERIQGIERNLAETELNQIGTSPSTAPAYTTLPEPQDSKEMAAKFLGVPVESPFEEIRKAYTRLNERSDPSKFPDGSKEQNQAKKIQERIYWSYNTLTESIDPIERRFKSLEIE